jgi:hypothetical protein
MRGLPVWRSLHLASKVLRWMGPINAGLAKSPQLA